MVSQYAKNEQNMNSVERVLLYTALPPEGDSLTSQDPPASWPEKGAIRFSNVELAYREGLPLVLKGVSFKVDAGEKVRYILAVLWQQQSIGLRLELLDGQALVVIPEYLLRFGY
jgi:ABC-type transport system involved in cytochrome bd biosynthesis fused ATPase/permease subunit